MRRSKREFQVAHARRRLRERFDFEGSGREIDSILSMMVGSILSGRARHIEKQSNRVSVFMVSIDGIETYPVYDRLRKTIVTVLTKDMVESRAWLLSDDA